jgi:ABC-type Fe3+ transport system permease subunit
MTSHSVEQSFGSGPSATVWRTRILWVLLTVAVLVLAYVLLAAFVPRWWAQRVADVSGHGSFSRGIWSGLILGFVCTLVPLLLVLSAVLVWRRRGGRYLAGVASVLAVATALPNLMTLSITLGTSDAAHAGERVLDVDAPGFRGAALAAAIAAGVVFLLILTLMARGRFRQHRAQRRERTAQGTRAESGTPASETRRPDDT